MTENQIKALKELGIKLPEVVNIYETSGKAIKEVVSGSMMDDDSDALCFYFEDGTISIIKSSIAHGYYGEEDTYIEKDVEIEKLFLHDLKSFQIINEEEYKRVYVLEEEIDKKEKAKKKKQNVIKKEAKDLKDFKRLKEKYEDGVKK